MYKFKKDYFPEINISWADAVSKIDEDAITGYWGYTQKPMLERFIPTIIGEGGLDWPAIGAGTTLFLIPVMIFTVVLRKHLLRGITFGAVRK